jgi:hypothetical protein
MDPRSTGPNILAWTELEDFRFSGDADRLRDVFPGLVAYHRWWHDWRTHPDGGYWTSGWGSGMDNQTRIPDSEIHHRHYTWLDATLQQALSARCLLEIGRVIGRDEFDAELRVETEFLTAYVNDKMWDEATGFYYDRAPDGTLSTTKSLGAYWALLARVVPPERLGRFVAHLDDPASFNRPHRVPTQAADSPVYHPYGGYWQGAIWSPTNLMVLAGLAAHGFDELAHAIAVNHVEQVAAVFADTGTLWENYAPEHPEHGRPAGRDFVGWTGLSAITIPIEYAIGLRRGQSGADVQWVIRLPGHHGVLRYPLLGGEADLLCEGPAEYRVLTIRASHKFTLDVLCSGVIRRFALEAGTHRIALDEGREEP